MIFFKLKKYPHMSHFSFFWIKKDRFTQWHRPNLCLALRWNFWLCLQVFSPNSWMTTLTASMIGGVCVTLFMTPFDVVATRLYNQPVGAGRVGLLYTGLFNCFVKIYSTEGLFGFYKGWAASYLRLGPHTTLSLMLWDQFRRMYNDWKIQEQ